MGSQQCGKESEVTLEDFERAARTVRSYDICIVTEWMAEMAPLLKYLLGFEHLDAAPRNVLDSGGPAWARAAPTLRHAWAECALRNARAKALAQALFSPTSSWRSCASSRSGTCNSTR